MSKTTLLTQVKNPGAFSDFFENTDNGTILGFVVVFLLILAVVAFFAWLLTKSARGMKGQREEKEKQEWRTVKYNSTLNGTVTHVSGLPMGEGVTLELYYGPKQLVFWKDGTEVILPREKVRSIDLASQKATQLQLQQVPLLAILYLEELQEQLLAHCPQTSCIW